MISIPDEATAAIATLKLKRRDFSLINDLHVVFLCIHPRNRLEFLIPAVCL